MGKGLLLLEGAADVLANGDSQKVAVKQDHLRATFSPENCGRVPEVKGTELE